MILERLVKISSELEFIAVTLYVIFRVREVEAHFGSRGRVATPPSPFRFHV
jgi:hypothetical protein